MEDSYICGIHGVINLRTWNNTDATKFVNDGFVAGSLRGMDSSGALQVDSKGTVYTYKQAMSGSDFVRDAKALAYVRDAATSVLTVCHTRAATRGKVSAENAHPFNIEVEDDKLLVGVHNGTLHSWEGKKKKGKDVEVDSNWAFQHIAEKGVDAFEDFTGAFCFIWYDMREPGKVFMARNTQRPMHFSITKDKAAMYFASEAGMVAWLLDRNDIRTEDEVYSLEPMKLYTFDLTGKEITFSKGDLPSFRAPVSNSAYGGNGYVNNYDRNSIRSWNAAKAQYEFDPIETDDGIDEWDYNNWNGSAYNHASKPVYDADGVPESGLLSISNIGKILGRGRAGQSSSTALVPVPLKKLEEKAETSTAANVNKMLDKVIADVRKKTDDDEAIMPASFYRSTTATQAEQAAAKKLGVFGELQWLSGVLYDPDVCAVLGEIDDHLPGHGRVKYDAELRNVTASIADRKYINNVHPRFKRSGDWVCIIGVMDDPIMKKRQFIVSELTDEGRKKVNEQMKG